MVLVCASLPLMRPLVALFLRDEVSVQLLMKLLLLVRWPHARPASLILGCGVRDCWCAGPKRGLRV